MINNLTNGISRLSEEISALRHNRAALTCDLVLERANLGSTVAEMIAGFQRDREEKGERTKAELGESRADLENTVSGMIAGFQSDREEMGEKTRVELGEFVSNVKDAVAHLRAEFASDIIGARTAWSGSAAERTPNQSGSEKPREVHLKTKKKRR